MDHDPALSLPLFNMSDCFLDAEAHETYGCSVWLYTFFVPQDMAPPSPVYRTCTVQATIRRKRTSFLAI